MISANMKNYRKRAKKILDATNNGKCWWLYQMLTHNYRQRRKDNEK